MPATDDHDHPHEVLTDLGVAVLTISSSRSVEADSSGDALVSLIEDAGHDVVARELVTDDVTEISEAVEGFVSTDEVEAVITSGGTGLSPTDVTVEALHPQFDREIPGFGELFRSLSYDDIGPRAILSRATGGVIDGVPVFCLPGSEAGATFGTEELILPTVAHIVSHTQGES